MGDGVLLSDLQDAGVGSSIVGDPSVKVHGIRHDSRQVQFGELFAALIGKTFDGTSFAASAESQGASAVLSESRLELDIPQLLCDDVRSKLGLAAEVIYGHPTQALSVTGITGTNGKTTTAHILERLLTEIGRKTALTGTVVNKIGNLSEDALRTTPEADDVSRFAREAVDAGVRDLVMEVSSHGIAMQRVDAIEFEVAAFTNLSQDHLDFHKTMTAYGEAKAQLFLERNPKISVVNVDDAFGRELASRISGRCIRCSVNDAEAELRADEVKLSVEGIAARLTFDGQQAQLKSGIVGAHNLENLLVAIGCAVALGVDFVDAVEAASRAVSAPGRLERIEGLSGVSVLVDYAHTPDAIKRVLEALAPTTEGRLIVVFGAGGDRDTKKRAPMGRVAAEGADVCIVTSDNPRHEDPNAILDEVEQGVTDTGLPRVELADLANANRGFVSFVDRRIAIRRALESARQGDTVLIAGKGHETYQILGDQRIPFDDRQEARDVIAMLQGRS